MKIKTNGNGDLHVGHKSELTCEGIDMGKFISEAIVTISCDELVTAACTVMLTDFETDGALLKINGIKAPDEVKDALREYFKNEITA